MTTTTTDAGTAGRDGGAEDAARRASGGGGGRHLIQLASRPVATTTTTTTLPAKVVPSPVRVEDVGGGVGRGGGGVGGSGSSLSRHNSFTRVAASSAAADPDAGGGEAGVGVEVGGHGNGNGGGGGQRVDFIGPSEAVRHLFSLPYNNDSNVSVALHNMGNGTILLDSGEAIIGRDEAEAANNTKNENSRTRGRLRRQRPRSWSIREEEEEEEDGNQGPDDGGASEESNRTQLAQLREGERSLLASLSLLMEEEKQQQQEQQLFQHDHTDIVSDDGEEGCGDIIQLSSSSGSEKEGAQSIDSKNSSALAVVVPSSAIVVHKGAEDESEPEPIINASSVPTRKNAGDPNDPLAAKLHPPQHYLSHAVTAPAEPRQYVDWKFHDMKLLVASDALIYKQNDGTGGAAGTNNSGGRGATDSAESIAIRVADASDLRSQLKYHESTAGEEGGGPSGNCHPALPPSSYAEALLSEEESSGAAGREESLLQTCIIPVSSGVGPELAQMGFSLSPFPPATDDVPVDVGNNGGNPSGGARAGPSNDSPLPRRSSSPVCTVLDAYLDNVMANVPQLALVLREHGYVQNIKLLQTEDIPSLMMHPSTLGVDDHRPGASPAVAPIFSPDIVEMNAAMLLRFLKTNCTRENSTYLLHRAAGDTNIQLFDISSISKQRQRKWVWWLALCSYRFACRLEQLQANVLVGPRDGAARREYRRRQRGLLHNTLDLLEELADMDGGRHDTIGAAVCEHLADTYLWNDEAEGDVGARDASRPAPCASSSQPYRNVTADCLNKAHDHLLSGIKKLNPLLAKAKKDKSPIEIEAISTQLYGIHHKIVNVNLRLADHHLQNYFSSNLIQSLRMAARMLSDATSLLDPLNIFKCSRAADGADSDLYARSILLQYAWLWEYCGHFARSFAADDLWRDRGHTCGADLIGLFREVNVSCSVITKQCFGGVHNPKERKSKISSVVVASHGQVSLNSLSGIIILPKDFEQIVASVLQKEGCHEAIGAAKAILDDKTQIKRDARLVLVAACVCYGHAIDSYVLLAGEHEEEVDGSKDSPAAAPVSSKNDSDSADGLNLISVTLDGAAVAPLLRQRLGDACNELGKILLNESRTVLLPQFSPRDKSTIVSERFGMSHVSAIMLASAQFWFLQGLEQFAKGKDLRNLALLRCNLCQCCKIRANTNVILPGTSAEDSRKNNSETYLQEAVDHLVSAHEAMAQRDADPVTWDMVSEELAATLLVLGVRRRQSGLSSSSEPLLFQAMRLTPGAEMAIVEPMERSCQIYESLGTARASRQAAAAHYQLALYFSKVWTCQRDEVKTREKLAAAFKHYGAAHQYFFQHCAGNETTFIILCLDFSNLYSAVVSGEESLYKALMCCLDTREAFSLPVAPSAMEQMATLAESVEARVSAIILNLVKIEKESNSKLTAGQEPSNKYKNMYRSVLTHKMNLSGNIEQNNHVGEGSKNSSTFPIFELLKSLSRQLI